EHLDHAPAARGGEDGGKRLGSAPTGRLVEGEAPGGSPERPASSPYAPSRTAEALGRADAGVCDELDLELELVARLMCVTDSHPFQAEQLTRDRRCRGDQRVQCLSVRRPPCNEYVFAVKRGWS